MSASIQEGGGQVRSTTVLTVVGGQAHIYASGATHTSSRRGALQPAQPEPHTTRLELSRPPPSMSLQSSSLAFFSLSSPRRFRVRAPCGPDCCAAGRCLPVRPNRHPPPRTCASRRSQVHARPKWRYGVAYEVRALHMISQVAFRSPLTCPGVEPYVLSIPLFGFIFPLSAVAAALRYSAASAELEPAGPKSAENHQANTQGSSCDIVFHFRHNLLC